LTHRVVIPFALICGVLAALASTVRAQSPVPAMPEPLPATPVLIRAPVPFDIGPACRRPAPSKPAAPKAPSRALFDAFGILRRERTDADTLSKAAREALTRAGVRVHDLNTARLLRETRGGGRAWVVPVADVTPLLAGPFAGCVVVPSRARPPRRSQRRPAPAARVPFGPAPFPVYAPQLLDGKPQEGLVVIAEGDVPGGGGGTHKQLIRGLAAPAVAPCSGPKHDLVGVSGIVPDGVGAAFLTSADGTAIKADVKDNGYAFLVAPAKGREAWAPRYVVWTGGDGTPHVQQVSLGNLPARLCRHLAAQRAKKLIGLTPSPATGPFAAAPGVLRPALPVPRAPRPSRPPRPRRP